MTRNRQVIITSADYVNQEIQSEFGKIPPSFLPIGNRRLYEIQFNLLENFFDEVIISLPQNFNINAIDKLNFEKFKIKCLFVPTGLTLGESLIYLIHQNEFIEESFSIIHGDSLLKDFDYSQEDSVSVNKAPDHYDWGNVIIKNNIICKLYESKFSDAEISQYVLSGWFAFSSKDLFIKCLENQNGKFIDGIYEYSKINSLKPVEPKIWLDFGHLNKFYESRKLLTTERYFNKIEISDNIIKKSSNLFSKKIQAEIDWYSNLPKKLSIFTPIIIDSYCGDEESGYSMKYLNYPTLSEIYVFGKLKINSWKKIFISIRNVLDCFAKFAPTKTIIDRSKISHFYKAYFRLEDFLKSRKIDDSVNCIYNGKKLPSLKKILDITSSHISSVADKDITVVHGDFCFSNIFYDNRSNSIYLIDPRGLGFDNKPSIYGDRRYDIAKLYHSVIGRYDHIIGNQFNLKINGTLDYELEFFDQEYYDLISDEFVKIIFEDLGFDESSIKAITILIFISMLPLHSDDKSRQNALLANSLRLFTMLD